jgi:hypothetical protein
MHMDEHTYESILICRCTLTLRMLLLILQLICDAVAAADILCYKIMYDRMIMNCK